LAALAIVVSGILHICATLAAPSFAGRSAVQRIADGLPVNTMRLLAPVSPTSQPLPFLAPDAHFAMCRFETSGGQVLLKAVLPEPGWVLSVYAQDGTSLFSATPEPGRRVELLLQFVPSDERFMGLTLEARGSMQEQSQPPVTIAAQNGLAVVRAPDKGFAYVASTMAELAKSTCQQRAS
jgi:uncharacterized membrane protein